MVYQQLVPYSFLRMLCVLLWSVTLNCRYECMWKISQFYVVHSSRLQHEKSLRTKAPSRLGPIFDFVLDPTVLKMKVFP